MHRLAKPVPVWATTRHHSPVKAANEVAVEWANIWRTEEIGQGPQPCVTDQVGEPLPPIDPIHLKPVVMKFKSNTCSTRDACGICPMKDGR